MGKGRMNKVLKLTAAKVKYIIRAKTGDESKYPNSKQRLGTLNEKQRAIGTKEVRTSKEKPCRVRYPANFGKSTKGKIPEQGSSKR